MAIEVTLLNSNQMFELSNDNISYIFYVNSLGVPVNLYFGKKINSLDIDCLESINNTGTDCYNYLDLSTKKEVNFNNPYFSLHSSKLECPPNLTFDKRGALIKITNLDNSSLTDFRYKSHRVDKGKPTLSKLPYIKADKDECETLVITLEDLKSHVLLEMYYTIFNAKNIIVRHNKVINNTQNALFIDRCYSFSLDLPSNDYKITSLHGAYGYDREVETQLVKHNTIKIQDNYGGKGFYHNPMIMLNQIDSNDTCGEVLGFGLVYSSNFSFDITGDNVDQTRIQGGLNDENFSWELQPGSSFSTPEAVIVYSSQGSDEVTNQFHNLIRENLLRRDFKNNKSPILLNSWEACYFDFDTNKIIAFIDEAKVLGIDLIVLDDGWFSHRNSDDSSLGDWTVNEKKIDLGKVIEYAHANGIKFGLWFEPEMISYNSNLYKTHPEFALYDPSINPTILRHQLVLDMTNPQVVENIFNQLCLIFDTYPIDYCKWDFNRFITEAISQTLPPKNQKEVYHRFMMGSYNLLNKFISKYPNILLETCAGGGGRFDMGMLFYSTQIWCSDETDATSRVMLQYATNMFYPLSTIGSHVSSRKFLSIKEKASIAIFGTFGYELDPKKLTEEDKKEVRIANSWFNKYKKLIDEGDYYSLLNPNISNFASWEVIDKDKTKALVLVFNFKRVNNNSRFIKLKHLNPNALYINSLDDKQHFGDYYMNIGLNICEGRESYTPQLVYLNKVEK